MRIGILILTVSPADVHRRMVTVDRGVLPRTR